MLLPNPIERGDLIMMKRTRQTTGRRARKGLALAAPLLACLAACSSTPEVIEEPAPGVGAAVDRIALELARKASGRVEISTLRVALHEVAEVEGDGISPLPSRYASDDLSVLTNEVAGEVTIALASNFHLIDRELMEPLEEAWRSEGLTAAELVDKSGATHLVVGTISPRDDSVQLNLRLVDAKNYVIIATARGDLPVQLLSDRSRVALGDILAPRGRRLPTREDMLRERMQPPEPIRVTDRGVAQAEPLVPETREIEAAGYRYGSARTRNQATPTRRDGPAAARFAALGRNLDD